MESCEPTKVPLYRLPTCMLQMGFWHRDACKHLVPVRTVHVPLPSCPENETRMDWESKRLSVGCPATGSVVAANHKSVTVGPSNLRLQINHGAN